MLPLLLLALLLAACGGGDDDDDDGDGTPDATTAASDDNGDSTASPSPTVATDTSDDDGADVSELLAQFQESEFRVSYDITSTSAGQEFSGRMTWYRALDGRTRFEFDVEQEGQAFDVITIVTEEASYFCSAIAGAKTCFEFSDDAPLALPDPSEPFVAQIENFGGFRNFGDVTSETIAGVEGRCVEVDEQAVTGQICVSDVGLLLRADTQVPGGAFRMELVDFEFDVSDSDFEPPFPVSSFPGG